MGRKKGLRCPAGSRKEEKKCEKWGRAGQGREKQAEMPRRERKRREKAGKVSPGGARKIKTG